MQQQTSQQPQPQFNVEGGHLVMFHKEHTGLPQVKDANVNDRDRMQDLLAQEKYLTAAYNVAMIEAGHEALFQVIRQNFDSCHQIQRKLFNTMFKKGWYKLPVADAESVAHTYEQFQQYQSQLPFPPGQQRATLTQQNRTTNFNANVTDRNLQAAVDKALHDAMEGNIHPINVPNSRH